MKAFKFRPVENFDRVLDILQNRRLYCAEWRTLNDPMEGIFAYRTIQGEDDDGAHSAARKLSEGKRDKRICSLSSTFNSHLLWAHYASGFKGVAIEVELSDADPEIRPVDYRPERFLELSIHELEDPSSSVRALTSKHRDWEYEQEIRILTTREWYALSQPIHRVIAGARMPNNEFNQLRGVCKSQGIVLCTTGIGDEEIDADVYEPPLPTTTA